MPRYMMMHKLDENIDGAYNPSPEFMARMGEYMSEVAKAGILLAGDGLVATSAPGGARRITVQDGKRTVTDGPFAETKELIAGFAIIEVDSLDTAYEWASRFADVFGTDMDIEFDVRRVAEMADITPSA